MKFEIFKFKKVTSTNDMAIDLIKKKKRKSGCVYADEQTKGRGTYGKKWISCKGNLFGSIFFQLKKSYPSFNEFALINPIIISSVFENFCDKKNIAFKWPNDIFLNKKKICGILQELIYVNGKKFLVIGIGINILSSPKINLKYQATNILEETQNKLTVKKVLNLVVSSYENFFFNIKSYNYENFMKKNQLFTFN